VDRRRRADVLRLVSSEGWPIPRYVEYRNAGTANAVDEVKKRLAYAMQSAG